MVKVVFLNKEEKYGFVDKRFGGKLNFYYVFLFWCFKDLICIKELNIK